MIAKVYRVPESARNWKGAYPGELDDYLIGTITGLVMGGPSVQPLGRNFPNTVSTEGLLGIPWTQESGITVQQYDRLVTEDGTLWAVTSDRLWTEENVLTGTQPSYYWVEVQSTT